MFGNSFNYNSMPTSTQPYGYPMNPYLNNINAPMQNQMPQTSPNQAVSTNTNKIYVSGIEDVRNTRLMPNSDYVFLDNDKPIIYQKVVDGKGQFEVKVFDIIPHQEQETQKDTSSINLSDYVLKKDFDNLQEEIKTLRSNLEKFTKEIKKAEESNGTNRISSGNNGTN